MTNSRSAPLQRPRTRSVYFGSRRASGARVNSQLAFETGDRFLQQLANCPAIRSGARVGSDGTVPPARRDLAHRGIGCAAHDVRAMANDRLKHARGIGNMLTLGLELFYRVFQIFDIPHEAPPAGEEQPYL